MEKKNLSCPSCGPLAAQIEEASGGSYRQYDQILQKLMELEQRGDMELFAGDCPLDETDAALASERHYTVCHYMRCRRCGALYFAGACIRGSIFDRSHSRPDRGLARYERHRYRHPA